MSRLLATPSSVDVVEPFDLEKSVQKIVQRSNLKASLQPTEVRKAMLGYLEPEETQAKPWETWL